MMRRYWPLSAALLWLSACAGAPTTPPSAPAESGLPLRLLQAPSAGLVAVPIEGRTLSLIVYHQSQALVGDRRRVELPVGASTLRFAGVSPQLEPASVRLLIPSGEAPFTIKEQFFSADVVTPARLLELYVGREVEVRMPGEDDTPSTIVKAVLLSADGPVVRIGDKIYLKSPGEVIVPAVPPSLNLTPTLEWRLNATAAFSGPLEASYLTRGVNWQAEYVLTLNAAQTQGALQGWASLTNQSGMAFEDARVTVVAGTLHKAGGIPRPFPAVRREYAEDAGGGAFSESPLSEFHRYDLEGRTTLANNQTKQLPLLTADAVPVERRLRFESHMGQLDENPRSALLRLSFRNDAAPGLGKPLPQGRMRVYQGDALIGEDHVPNTPKGELVRLTLGEAFDVVGERKQTEATRPAEKVREETYAITVRNHKTTAAAVDVVERPFGTWTITKSSHDYTKVSASEIAFPLAVPAGGEVTVTYTIRFTEQ